MTHFLFPRRPSIFAEARLLRMAPGPDVPKPPEADATAKAEKAPSTPDPRATFQAAKERMNIHGERLKALQDKLAPLRTLKVRHEAKDEKLTAKDFEAHGITDANADGSHADETQQRITELEAQIKEPQDEVNKANQEIQESLKQIEASGPDGKSEAVFMRIDAVMNDPNASMFQKFAALLKGFAEIQAVLKGITTPGGAPGAKPGEKGPETNRNSPSGKKESVRQMMKDGNHDKVGDLRTAKEANVTALQPEKANAEVAVTAAKNTLTQAQADQTTAESDLASNKEDPAKQAAARNAKAKVGEAEAAVKMAQETLASVTKDLASAEADVKMIKEVESDVTKDVADFENNKTILEGKLKVLADNENLSEEQREDLGKLREILKAETTEPAENGIDISLKITAADMKTFVEPFIKAGVDPKSLTIGAGGDIADPAAFQRGMDQLIAKMTAAGEKKPDEPAAAPAPAAPAAPAGAPPAGGAGV